MLLLKYSDKVNDLKRFCRILCSIYRVSELTNVTVTYMIRFSIFFLAIFSLINLGKTWGQNPITFTCYNLDSLSWDLSIPGCPSPDVDSFRILTRSDQNSDFNLLITSTDPAVRGYRDDFFKTEQAVLVQYFVNCPDIKMVQSDTMSLSSLREAVEIDSVRILSNGDVQLTWKEKPISGVKYSINTIEKGSSKVLATNILGNNFTDSRGLATRNIEYYSISAALDCGYTFPEPDSFYHTSFLTYDVETCGGEITFDFIPFSLWQGGTSESSLIILRNNIPTDTLNLTVGQSTFTYDDLLNQETYTFYVRESGNAIDGEVAYSNSITINTDFYEPIKWIVIDELTPGDNNQATLSWTTNNHTPGFPFQLHRNNSSIELPLADLITEPGTNRYSYILHDLPQEGDEYRIKLQDSCGNTIESLPKRALLTQGQLNGGIDLNIKWTDIADKEWIVHSYDIFYEINGSYSILGSANGSTLGFQHSFDENNPLDSVCYYVVATGELYFPDADSLADLTIKSNTVCLHGETIVQLPNSYSSNQAAYKPIIVPQTNITSYTLRIFDRYGNMVFESHNPSDGWDGKHQGKDGFMDVYVVQVKITNREGEQIEKSGSLLLFP